MISKEELGKFISKVIKPGSEVLSIEELGRGMHGTGFLIKVKTKDKEERYILKTIHEGGFGHEYPSDRAKFVVDALLNYPSLPKGNKFLAAGSVQEDGSLKDLGNPKDFFMIVEEVQGDDFWNELKRTRDSGKLDQKGKDTLIKLADYLAELHSIKPENRVVPERYMKFVRDFIGSGELTLGVLDTFPKDLPFITDKDITEIVQKQVEWWSCIKHKHHRLTTVHGDFHPGNVIFTDNDFVAMDRSRTKYGDACHDVFDIVINIINYSIMSYGEYKKPFKEMVEVFLDRYLEKTKDQELLEMAPFFISFIAIVCVHPLFYSAEWLQKQGFSGERIKKLDESKKRMVCFNKNVLNDSKFDYNNIKKYFEEPSKEEKTHYVFWFTGLPGSGKSTTAKKVIKLLKEKNINTELLRMDELIKEVQIKREYDETERDMFYKFTIATAKELSKHTPVFIDSTAHKKEWRDLARELIPNFIEVYIKCPLETAVERESKRKDNLVIADMYKKAAERLKTGKEVEDLGEVIGIDVPYEEPDNPEIIVQTDAQTLIETVADSIALIINPALLDPRLSKIMKTVEEKTDKSSHGYPHVVKVMNRSIVLGKNESADLKILAPSALLHDIGLFFGGKSKGHSVLGAEIATELLGNAGYTEKEQKEIAHCISAHNCRYEGIEPETKEAKVLLDADTLEKLGASSIKRAEKYLEETNKSEKEFAKEWVESRERLIKENKLFYTETGKKYVEKALEETVGYWKTKI